MSNNLPDQLFVVCWCNTGLECVIAAHNPEHQKTMAILANKPVPENIEKIVGMLTLRARFNIQRHYEIYSVLGADGVDEDMIRQMFENAPQYAANLIRERGTQLYSDRAEPGRYKIQ